MIHNVIANQTIFGPKFGPFGPSSISPYFSTFYAWPKSVPGPNSFQHTTKKEPLRLLLVSMLITTPSNFGNHVIQSGRASSVYTTFLPIDSHPAE